MTPEEYISSVRPLELDETSKDNIEDLKNHILSGKTLDPLAIYSDGKEDGRHRAYAAKELGIKSVPVIKFKKEEMNKPNEKPVFNFLSSNPMKQGTAIKVSVGSGGVSQPIKGATKESIETQFRQLVMHNFMDDNFLYNYCPVNQREEYKELVNKYYNEIVSSDKKFSEFWVKFILKSGRYDTLYEIRSTKYNEDNSSIEYNLQKHYPDYVFIEYRNIISSKLRSEYIEYRKEHGPQFNLIELNELEEKAESFSDCLTRNGINLEKDSHRFEVGTKIKDNIAGTTIQVRSINEDSISFNYISALSSVPGNEFSNSYSRLIEAFNTGGISVDGFNPDEKMEFARVLNTIQHCIKMDKLDRENKELKTKLENSASETFGPEVMDSNVSSEQSEIDEEIMKSQFGESNLPNLD
jgi:hypothetical protein